MQLLILAGFIIALSFQDIEPLEDSNWLIAPGIVLYLVGTTVLAWMCARLKLRAFQRVSVLPLPRRSLPEMLKKLWMLGGLVGLILVGYARWLMEDMGLKAIPLAVEAGLLLPFAGAIVLMWTADYPLVRRARTIAAANSDEQTSLAKGWTIGGYLGYNMRHQLLFIALPIGLIIGLLGGVSLLTNWLLPKQLAEKIFLASSLPIIAGTFLVAPVLIARLWKTYSLPESPLRSKLEEICHKLNLTYRDIRVWPSNGMVANAGVMGLIGSLRYVLLSDALLDRMDDRDIEAVFAHEAGHIMHHHIFYSAMFVFASVVLGMGAVGWVSLQLMLSIEAERLLAVGVWLGILWVGFGWVSRRFEWQCDAVAAWACGQRQDGDDPDLITHEGAAVFAKALKGIAQLNGTHPLQPNWRHGTIAQRITMVLWLGGSSGTKRTTDRKVWRIKIGIWLLAAAAAGLLVCDLVFRVF